MFGRPVRSPYAYFYPRPPRGGRRVLFDLSTTLTAFLSTPSARRATFSTWRPLISQGISIHALREEGDYHSMNHAMCQAYFYPRPPRGGRRQRNQRGYHSDDISIHALREEGDQGPQRESSTTGYYYPRPPRGGRPV